MTNVLAPYNESKSIYNGYKNSGLLNTSLSFVIPIYENMPDYPVQSPDVNKSDFIQDNTLVYCNATNVNIRTGPGTSYEIITTVSNPDKMTRVCRGNQIGERWDKVVLANGIVGFIYQTYSDELPVRELTDSEIKFDTAISINNLKISGLDYTKNTVNDLFSKITTNLDLEFLNNKNKVINESDLVGTGSKIRVKENDVILREYTIILYGDANGDGKINSIDLLVLQRHILEIENIDEFSKIACNIRKNGKKPTSIDLLLIQRHILELEIINQSS